MKIGFGVSYYGPANPQHRDSIRDLRDASLGCELRWIELSGSAYPEMSYAELFRSALAEEVDVMVICSHRMTFRPEEVRDIAQCAFEHDRICWRGDYANLSFTAIPLTALIAMSEKDERTYSNTGVLDTGFSGKARPFASPWKQRVDGSVLVDSLIPGIYMAPEQAFFERSRSAGIGDQIFRGERLPFTEPMITHRMKLGDANKRFAAGIRHNYAFCIPTYGGLDHHQQNDIWNLEKSGCTTIEYRDCPYIDLARSVLTKLALDSGHDGIFFIDHDIMFVPWSAIEMIDEAEERQDVVSAVYCMRKTAHSLIGAPAVSVGRRIGFFEDGDVYPSLYSGLGFSAIPKAVIHALDEVLPELYSPLANLKVRPYYALDVNGSFYSGEDASFCARVQGLTIKKISGNANPNGLDWDIQAAPEKALTRHKVLLDTRVRIFHRGSYDYGIEDHSIAVPRYAHLQADCVASRGELRLFMADKMSVEAQLVAQGANEGAEEPHSILEEKGPCVCTHLHSNHLRQREGYAETHCDLCDCIAYQECPYTIDQEAP